MSTTASPASLVFSAVEEYGSTKRIPLSDPNVDRMMQRDDLRPATRAWLESQYGVETKEPGEWVQTLEFVDDGVDTMVLQGDRRVYVNEPRSGQKLEIGYFKDETTVGELRNKLRTLLQRGRAKYANGSGFEVDTDMPNARLQFLSAGIFPPGIFPQDDQFLWTTGPLICGGVVLADDSKTLSSYQVKDQCVIFSISSVGEALAAATDPDLALDAVKQIQGMTMNRVLRHEYRGPGGVSGN